MSIHNMPFSIYKRITLNNPKSVAMEFVSKGLKNKLKTAVVNEPSVFESLKFYCIGKQTGRHGSCSPCKTVG